ncbi:MAG: hypothetical protein NXI15_10755 [Gammaproteobacteria bacterium]|nr:hypothetical protein [Gammaproteobacteria bacterium]
MDQYGEAVVRFAAIQGEIIPGIGIENSWMPGPAGKRILVLLGISHAGSIKGIHNLACKAGIKLPPENFTCSYVQS